MDKQTIHNYLNFNLETKNRGIIEYFTFLMISTIIRIIARFAYNVELITMVIIIVFI